MNAADVDSYYDPLLNTFGEIGIRLDSQPVASSCRIWLIEQFVRYGRIQCPLPCPPTYELLKQVVGFSLRYRYRRYKSRSVCVFSNRKRVSPPMECCYNTFSNVLVDNPEPGAGRAHLYHPYVYYTNYREEERIYQDCCSGRNSFLCAFFHILRPPCKSDSWVKLRPRLRKLETIFY